jgi:hypothetical protein
VPLLRISWAWLTLTQTLISPLAEADTVSEIVRDGVSETETVGVRVCERVDESEHVDDSDSEPVDDSESEPVLLSDGMTWYPRRETP